ncbi:hypothetical protein D1BOALGB6SA_4987 [Olavius sp. associated proteobacterium Delta 1]|nr:hypothetical protein D1BOALGB6SA_4987 [Olavius sp. associated proteobacterium Delta 1]
MKKTLIFTILMIACCSVIFAAAPTLNEVGIRPASPYTNDDLIGYCNASDTDGDNLTYYYKWYLNDTLNSSGWHDGFCYQETPNVATTCGGLNTGTYVAGGFWGGAGPSNKFIDGDWDTAAFGGNFGWVFVNYTKPAGARSTSLWQIGTGSAATGNTILNKTIPVDCWNQDILQFIAVQNNLKIKYCL